MASTFFSAIKDGLLNWFDVIGEGFNDAIGLFFTRATEGGAITGLTDVGTFLAWAIGIGVFGFALSFILTIIITSV